MGFYKGYFRIDLIVNMLNNIFKMECYKIFFNINYGIILKYNLLREMYKDLKNVI